NGPGGARHALRRHRSSEPRRHPRRRTTPVSAFDVRRFARGSFAVLALAPALTCGGRTMTSASTDACRDYAAAWCDLRQRCEPNSIRDRYGDLRACVEREALTCNFRSSIRATGWQGAAIATCTAAKRTAICFALGSYTWLADCNP